MAFTRATGKHRRPTRMHRTTTRAAVASPITAEATPTGTTPAASPAAVPSDAVPPDALRPGALPPGAVAGASLGKPARDSARVRMLRPAEDAQQRRLAAAVRAQHADPGARRELEIESGEHLATAERRRDPPRRQQRDGRYELSSA